MQGKKTKLGLATVDKIENIASLLAQAKGLLEQTP